MMEIQIIDFNGKFMKEFLAWEKDHPEAVKDDDNADDLYYDMMEAWFDKKQPWLENMSPNEYFHGIDSAEMLVSLWIEYMKEEVEVPEPLEHCLFHRRGEIEPIFHGILMCDESPDMEKDTLLDVQAEIIRLLREMDLRPLLSRYMDVMASLTEDCAYIEEAGFAFADAGEEVKEMLLENYPRLTGMPRVCVIDLLSSLLPDPRIWEILLSAWREGAADDIFLVECMGRYGSEEALPILKQAAESPETDYYLFREIKNAIEAISGEEIPEREYDGDALYDRMAAEDIEDEE